MIGREGKGFEEIFKRQAQMLGLLPIKNHLTARFIYKNKYKVMKSELDFTLISPMGKVAYLDCKTFQGEYFTYSKLLPHQITRAVTYNRWKVPAGMVVWFRKPNVISFYSGTIIAKAGSGARFLPRQGLVLGTLSRFDLRLIFTAGELIL